MRAKEIVVLSFVAALAGTPLTPAAAEPPETQTQGKIHFVSGGVGHDERDDMHHEAHHYNLTMTFANGADGAFLSSVDVTITDDAGKQVLQTHTRGPILLIELPKGRYRVTTALAGWITEHRVIEIGADHKALHVVMQPSPAKKVL